MPLTIYRRGKIWHYRGSVAGRQLRGSCRTEDETTARRFIAEKETTAWRGHFDGPEAVLTFAQAATYYRQAEKPTRFLQPIEDHWKDTLVRSISAGAIRQSAIKLYPRASAATRNRHVIVPTQAIINHAASLDLCRPISVQRFPTIRKERAYATWEWIEAFMSRANPHLGALACFMFLTGARVSEAIDLRWSDVDLQNAKALIKQTKVGSERIARLPPVLVAALANIESNREPGAKVFKYSSRDTAKPQWRKAIKRVGIAELTFHACRHGFATGMLHAGVDPVTIARLGGWKSTAHLFATYGHAMDDDTLVDRLVSTPEAQASEKRNKWQ